MPTGWRPNDVKSKYPLKKIVNPFKQKKYSSNNLNGIIMFVWMEYLVTSAMMLHLFILFDNQSMNLNYLYGAFIFVYIFKSAPTCFNSTWLRLFFSLKKF